MRTYVVWIPMLDRDEGASVPAASKHVGVSPQYFDGEKRVGDGLARAFGLDAPVWDSFFFYPPGAKWTATGLPMPPVAIAQDNGVVVGTPSALPPGPDQSKLPSYLSGKMIVVGEQKDFAALLEATAKAFLAAYRR